MSLLSRNAVRAIVRSSHRARFSSTHTGVTEYLAHYSHIRQHAADTTQLWRKISFYVCFPAVAACVAWVYKVESEHAAHSEHVREEHDGHLPSNPEYDYLNRRVKPYPWGNNSLFFNPHVNKDMNEAE